MYLDQHDARDGINPSDFMGLASGSISEE